MTVGPRQTSLRVYTGEVLADNCENNRMKLEKYIGYSLFPEKFLEFVNTICLCKRILEWIRAHCNFLLLTKCYLGIVPSAKIN